MKREELIQRVALLVLNSNEICVAYPGFPSMVETLVKEGKVKLPFYASEITQHFDQFSFIRLNGLVPNSIDLIEYSIDLERFKTSKEFIKHANAMIQTLDDSARKLENEMYESRIASNDLKGLIAEGFRNRTYLSKPDTNKVAI